jgi:C-terminal processing protease CtpA/Prc
MMDTRLSFRAVRFWCGVLVIAALASVALVEHRNLLQSAAQNRTLLDTIRDLRRVPAESDSNNLASLQSEIEQLRKDNVDLLRLRNDVHQLREQQQENESLRSANARLLQVIEGANLPSNQLAQVADIRKQGAVLGVMVRSTADAPEGASPAVNYPGAVVVQLDTNSPVAWSGLKAGDIIIGVNGRPVENPSRLQSEMLLRKPGDTVILDVIRNDAHLRVPVQTRSWGN